MERHSMKGKAKIVTVGAFLTCVICLIIGYWLFREPGEANLAPSRTELTSETPSKTEKPAANPPDKQKLVSAPDSPLIVSPTMKLDELIEIFEREVIEEAEEGAVLAVKVLEWKRLKQSGKKLWGSDKWMKEPEYYENLETPELAEECFSRHVFASEIGIFDDPSYAFERLKVFHNGFAELFERQDMWKGILHAYEYLSLKLDPENELRQIVDVSNLFLSLRELYGLPAFKEQINGRESAFLAANLRVLRKYKYYLEHYDTKERETPGFFGEPCVVAQVALMLTRQVDPQRYAKIEPTVTGVLWPREQRVENLKSFIDLVLASLEGVVPDE